MASPFFDAISAGVSSAPGTGTFTIGTVTSGFRAFSNVPANTIIQYRAEEGTSWEVGMGLWSGSTLTRKVMYSSDAANALISFTAAVVVSLTVSADRVQSHLGFGSTAWYVPGGNVGAAPSVTGSWIVEGAPSSTPQNNSHYGTRYYTRGNASANSAVSQYWTSQGCRKSDGTAYQGGFEFVCRWGHYGTGAIPTGAKLLVGFGGSNTNPYTGSGEPSAFYGGGFTKDSGQSTFHWRTMSGYDLDTGITLTTGAAYECAIWCGSGPSAVTYASMAKIGTSEVWFGSDAAAASNQKTPAGAIQYPHIAASQTSGTAMPIFTQNIMIKTAI